MGINILVCTVSWGVGNRVHISTSVTVCTVTNMRMYTDLCIHRYKHTIMGWRRGITVFIGKPMGRSIMISNVASNSRIDKIIGLFCKSAL